MEGVDVCEVVVVSVVVAVVVVAVVVWVVLVSVVVTVVVVSVVVGDVCAVVVVVGDEVSVVDGDEDAVVVALVVGVVTMHPSNESARKASSIELNVNIVSKQLLGRNKRLPNAQMTCGSLKTTLLSSSRYSLMIAMSNSAVASHWLDVAAVKTWPVNPNTGTSQINAAIGSAAPCRCTPSQRFKTALTVATC